MKSLIYAEFWARSAAFAADLVIISIAALLADFNPLVFTSLKTPLNDYHGLSIMEMLASVVLAASVFPGYRFLFHWLLGWTPGKRMFDLKITTTDGDPIKLKQALFRSVVDWLLAAVLMVTVVLDYLFHGCFESANWHALYREAWFLVVYYLTMMWYLVAVAAILFDARKRALHDYFAGTVVVYRFAPPSV